MARTNKSKTPEPVAAPVAPVAAPVAPVMDTDKPKKVSKKAVKTTLPDVSPVVPHEVAPVNEVVEKMDEVLPVSLEEAVDNNMSLHVSEFFSKLQQLGALMNSVKTDFRVLEKKWARNLKVAQKSSIKRKRKTGNRSPSGFVKPTRISDELAVFLEKPSGTEMARTEVTRDINKYIRNNNLQDKTNGRRINPDSKLACLLKIKDSDELTYFNLQRYMSPHFPKVVKPEVDTSVVV